MYCKNDLLAYSKDVYQAFYKEGFLCDFNHGKLTKGEINIPFVKDTIKQLNEIKGASNICFHPNAIENSLEGGSCSAIAFHIAQTAVSLFHQFDLSTKEDRLQFIDQIIKAVKAMDQVALKKNIKCSESRKTIRSIQAAFNTISIDLTQKTNDVAQDKIKALAAFYDLTVSTSTKQILVANNPSFEKDIDDQLKELSTGVHLLRIIQFEDNHKQETKGHSVVYIKYDQDIELYFDTQLGLYDLALSKSVDKDKKHLLYHSLLSANERFHVDSFKFHKLEQKNRLGL